MRSTLLLLPLLYVFGFASAAFAADCTSAVISPEVLSDNRVTFRFRAPNVKEVALSLEGASKDLTMQKDEQGVWSVTSEPLTPDFYGYSFVADGVHLIDPLILDETESAEYYEPGDVPGASLPWEVGDVPHGEVHHHFYKSGVVGDQRDFYVYTPPGYERAAGSKRIRCCICCMGSAMTRAAGPGGTGECNSG